jgi:hypothetical protein
MKNLIRTLRLLRAGWRIRFAYVKKYRISKNTTVTAVCYSLQSAEESDGRMAQ